MYSCRYFPTHFRNYFGEFASVAYRYIQFVGIGVHGLQNIFIFFKIKVTVCAWKISLWYIFH